MNAFYLLLYVVVLSTLAKADFQDVNYKVSSPSPNTQYNVNGTIFINYELLPTKNTYVNSIAIFFLQEANNYTITLNADLSQSTARNATDGNPSWQLSWSLPNSTVPGACTLQFNSFEYSSVTPVSNFVVNFIPLQIVAVVSSTVNTIASTTSMEISPSSTSTKGGAVSALEGHSKVMAVGFGLLCVCLGLWM